MPAASDLRPQIAAALGAFAKAPLLDASLGLFDALGYHSERRMKLRSTTADGFLGTFDRAKTLNPERALLADCILLAPDLSGLVSRTPTPSASPSINSKPST